MNRFIIQADASGEVVSCSDGLSFWGGVDPQTGVVIDAHHPLHGVSVAGKILMMPTSRGSCSGSGVFLELALNGHAPAALVFAETEEVLTLGAIIASRLFEKTIPVLRLSGDDFVILSRSSTAIISGSVLIAEGLSRDLKPVNQSDFDLSQSDLALIYDDPNGPLALAMEVVCTMAVALGAEKLIDVSRGHIDGCILAHDANLIFAERMADMGARVQIPTTINAISVDMVHWASQGVSDDFGNKASRLAEAYVKMGARPTFTCAPYFLDDVPDQGDVIGWSESNAVIYANSVLGAQTAKLPDYLDLFVAMTGRAPETGVYLANNRRPACIIECAVPPGNNDSLWPLIGWLAGRLAPDRIPLLTGLQHLNPSADDLRAICAAFGTTSAAPMLHVGGVTPEAKLDPLPDADRYQIDASDLLGAWVSFNSGQAAVDLVAIGSPHSSAEEIRHFCQLMNGRGRHPDTEVIITVGRDTQDQVRAEGWVSKLETLGVKVIPDICWCSITEPVFPRHAGNPMTNSGKYAHYAPGLSGRSVRFGSLAECAKAAVTGRVSSFPPKWLRKT